MGDRRITSRAPEGHGWRISVTSRPGEGSEFLFSLPAAHVAAAELRA
jgi:hypothetical protein